MTYAGDPRVLFKLFDLSLEDEAIIKSYVGVMGQFESGPMWDGVAIAAYDTEKLQNTFGRTVDWSQDMLCCLKAVESGANLVIHRIGHCTDISDRNTLDILPAFVLIPDRGGVPTAGSVQSAAGPFTFIQGLSGRVTGSEIGPFTIVTGSNDTFKVRRGVPGSWGPEQTVTLTQGVRTAQQICDDINGGTNGLNATVVDGKVHLEAIALAEDLEILAVTNDCYSALGLVAEVYAHVAGTDVLTVSVNGGADQSFNLEPAHGETGQFSLTSAEVVAQMAALTGATLSSAQGKLGITSTTTGTSSSVQVKSCTALAVFGFDTNLHSGAAGTVKQPWKFVMKGPGAYANGAKVYVYDSYLNPGEAINVRITVPDRTEEYFRELSQDSNDTRYWKTYINAHSQHLKVLDVDTPNAAPNNWPALSSIGYTISGGADGTLVLTDADWIGNALGKTGFYCTDHWTMAYIDMMIFGTTSAVVAQEFHTFITGRKGRFGWTPTIVGNDVNDVIAWRMGDPTKGYSHAAFNTWEAGVVGGRFTVFDSRNNEQVEIPALAFLAAAICTTDLNYGRHYSPFGVKRGQCPSVLGIDFNPAESAGDADLLAEYQINNARILTTSLENRGWEGAYLWGGWTLQRAMSALREVPVARKIKEYEWLLYPIGLSFINDPNHPVIWGEIHRTIEPILRGDLDAAAIYGYMIITDKDALFTTGGELKGAVLNTGRDIDQGIYRLRILIQPVRQIFYFVIEMGAMRTGEPFANYRTMYSLPGWARK